ncbi:RuBisCO chaperone RbcX [Roseofilum casamattae]|uniref:RuBisCO chaperone RbcX n=1 Tax=Roseofilum casamattae BLCC-M143 TaxID=3022442 RepID=A0ABT7BUW2_9CYAN|nr:chaperonin family protein RbcX [Roseofilum casamattae]MDJ1182063.1 chaperonin family protein RbcX [Roseofilum casamattae BLCC-M143]
MDIKHVAKATSRVLASYLTYQAVRTVAHQLRETNPGEAIWLHEFSSTGKIQDGETYLQELFQVKPEMAFRVMTVREHLAREVTDFLPEMVRDRIQQDNMELRRGYLERVTQLSIPDTPSDT